MRVPVNSYLKLSAYTLLLLCPPVVVHGQSADETAQATQAQPETSNQAAAEQGQDQTDLRQTTEPGTLELPENPTREQSQAFLDEMRRLTASKDRVRADDPEVQKLSKLPVEHIDLLLKEMRSGNRFMVYYAFRAMATHDAESYRKIALDGLSEEPDFIYLIARHGWYQDAKEDILAKLKAVDPKDAKFKPIWFQAFLEVAEPEHYPLLHEIALGFYDLGNRLKMLETLPGYDFAKTIDACWEKAKELDKDGKEQTAVTLGFMNDGAVKVTTTLAPYALRTGKIEALDPFVDQINPDRPLVSRRGETLSAKALEARVTVRRYLDFKGTNEEIQTWYRTNRDRLVFNPFTQRYELPQD